MRANHFIAYSLDTAEKLAAHLLAAEVAFTATPRPWAAEGGDRTCYSFWVAPDKAAELREAVGAVVR